MKLIVYIWVGLILAFCSSCKKADLMGIDKIVGYYQCEGQISNTNQPNPFQCNWSLQIEENGKLNFMTPGTPNGFKSKIKKITIDLSNDYFEKVSLKMANGKVLKFGLYGDTISGPFWSNERVFHQNNFDNTIGIKVD